ncbi:cytochrome ubiquinol oxidase subunit I [Novosphingobium lindaniclasticum]|uniref:cytochrome ubiquinol oxidase subunit I n=1 Tax=Novosphingobium lindaniclasticum TaxID=1329895 RepID=UPI0003F928BF
MEITPLLLARLQFAFTVSFHIIFPAFTIGLAAWLTCLEVLRGVDGKTALSDPLRFSAQDIRVCLC